MSKLAWLRDTEWDIYHYLQEKDTTYATNYKKNLIYAKKRVLHQVIQAIVREKVVDSYWKETEETIQTIIPISEKADIVIPVSKKYILEHLDIVGDILLLNSGEISIIEHPVEFLKLISSENTESQLLYEVDNAVIQYALALTGAEVRKTTISWKGDTFHFLLSEMKKNDNFSPLVFAEQWAIDGHTLHPCSKTRIGLSVEDVIRFSPEWGGRPSLIPVAVHKDHIEMTSIDDKSMTNILISEYPYLEKAFQEQIGVSRRREYELIPVHPWQLEHTIIPCFHEEIKKQIIIPLENVIIPTSALLSFRSLAPTNYGSFHHIKTAMNVQMTSAKRIVSPASVRNGPTLSTILKTIQMIDPVIGETISFLTERAGGTFRDSSGHDEVFKMKNLSAILRESPDLLLKEDEIATPAAFLINRSPFTGKLILLELIESFQTLTETDQVTAAVNYIHKYAELLLPGLLRLIAKYGISLEAHLQNAVPVFKNGIPVRFLLRDNGGIRIKEDRLKLTVENLNLDNSTNLLTDNERDLYNMFSHALIHNHLGEMIYYLSKETGIEDRVLWAPVREVIFKAISQLKQLPECQMAVESFEKEVRNPLCSLKALLKMRLHDQFIENLYTYVPNPLVDKEGVI